jgi:hypothetical protein
MIHDRKKGLDNAQKMNLPQAWSTWCLYEKANEAGRVTEFLVVPIFAVPSSRVH